MSFELHEGDCLEVMPKLAPASVAMVFADLPYGAKHTTCAWDSPFNLDALWPQLWQLLKRNGIVCATATQPFTTTLINSQKNNFRYSLVWAKKFAGSPATARFRPLRVHEDVCVFYREASVYNPQMVVRDKPIKLGGNKCQSVSAPIKHAKESYQGKIYTHKYPTSILTYSCREGQRGLHPTQKPVALLEWLIATYTNPGDTVLDPTMGSGVAGVACARLGRRFIGIEKDGEYFHRASLRIEAAYAQAKAQEVA